MTTKKENEMIEPINPLVVVWMLGVQFFILADDNAIKRKVIGIFVMTIAWITNIILCLIKLTK